MLGIRHATISAIRKRAAVVSLSRQPSTMPSALQALPSPKALAPAVGSRRGMAAMPLPQSATAVLFEGHETNEGWETTIFWWYGISFVMCCCILGMEPETGIDAWASKEARVRLEMKDAGFAGPFVFGKHYQSLSDEEIKREWDTFSSKALRMNDDDDDDDEEDDDEENNENGDEDEDEDGDE
jgi:hypothetical protein